MALTLNGWKSAAANLLVTTVPLQTFDGSLLLIDSYLASVGGWIPDIETDPVGAGVPANGKTPTQAVEDISLERYSRVHRVSSTVTLEIDMEYITNLIPGQTDEDIITQVKSSITDIIQTHLQKTPFIFNQVVDIAGSVITDGNTTDIERRELDTLIINGKIRHDPRAIALYYARTVNMVDQTWNVSSVYVESNNPIVVVISKYINDQYTTIDNTVDHEYIVNINATDYRIIGGITKTLNR